MFNQIYNSIYYLGLKVIRYSKRFFKVFTSVVIKPFRVVGAVLLSIIIAADKLLLKTFHEFVDELKELFFEVKRVFPKLKKSENGPDVNTSKMLKDYVKKAFATYKKVFVYMFNIILPIVSAVVLVHVIGTYKNMTLGLEINYNDEVIGCVRDEAEYKKARQMAMERLDISAAATENQKDEEDTELIGQASFKIKPVKLSQISDASVICDKLIEKSNCKITNACGIYIDDKFICAVKNETDALTVFDSVLAEHSSDEQNAVMSFVEDIDYVQGLYPEKDSIVRDASYLDEKLHSKKSEARYYTVQNGDTVSQIAQRFDMTTSQIFNLNPELKEKIYAGQKILLSGEVNFVRVQATKTEKRTVSVPFNTIKTKTDKLYVGDKKTVTKGVNGVQEITELVTYIDGVRVSSQEVGRVTVKEPVDEKIQIGTKKNYYGGGTSGSVTSFGGRLAWPTIGANSVSSYYGKRNFGIGWHGGIDIVRNGGSTGCPVVAAESGTVVSAGWAGAYGYCVRINHGNGMTTLYAHMQSGSVCVRAGQRVSRGQQVGRIGGTGNVTGPHLHFEVRINGNKVNPAPYLGIASRSNYR